MTGVSIEQVTVAVSGIIILLITVIAGVNQVVGDGTDLLSRIAKSRKRLKLEEWSEERSTLLARVSEKDHLISQMVSERESLIDSLPEHYAWDNKAMAAHPELGPPPPLALHKRKKSPAKSNTDTE